MMAASRPKTMTDDAKILGDATACIEAAIDRFEDAWNEAPDAPPQVADFFGETHGPLQSQLGIELLRVDMERRWGSDAQKSVSDYLQENGWLKDSADQVAELAFEEYRLRQADTTESLLEEYRERFGAATNGWPEIKKNAGVTETLRCTSQSTLNLLEQETDRLVEHIERYPNPGDTLGDFKIVEQMGQGKFAKVYLARQGELADRRVVLKLSPEMWQESERLARLQHTNIVPVYSIHRFDNLQAICMPYLGRTTLGDRLKESSTGDRLFKNEKSLCEFASNIACGLQHAHARNIIHRDLKPDNILLDPEEQPLILDFNLSEYLVVGGPSSLMVGGTLPYMAPEHLEAVISRERLGPQSDVYSLGVILYQMITGERPFPERSGNYVEAIAEMVNDRHHDQSWLEKLSGLTSPGLHAIIKKCMEPKLDHRYASAKQVMVDLERHSQDLPLLHCRNPSIRETSEKWWRRNRQWFSPSVLAVVAATLAAVAIVFGRTQLQRSNRLSALQQADSLADAFDRVRLPLISTSSPTLTDSAAHQASRLIEEYRVASSDWQTGKGFTYLDPKRQKIVKRQLGELCFLLARVASGSPNKLTASPVTYLQAAGSCLDPPHDELDVDRLDGESPLAQRLKIADLCSKREFELATPLLVAALEESPRDAALWVYRGFCHAASGQYSMAELDFTRCIALHPRQPIGYFHRGLARLQSGQNREAQADFERVLKLRPHTPEAQLNRLISLFRDGRADQVLLELTQGNEADGELAVRFKALQLDVLDSLNRSDDAEVIRGELLAIEPKDAFGWLARGTALRQSNPEEAIDNLQRANELSPTNRDAMQNLVAMYTEVVNEPQKALELLDRWCETFPGDSVPLASRAVVLARLGRTDEAEAAIEESLNRQSTVESYYYAASAYARLAADDPGYKPKATQMMRRCLQLDSTQKWFNMAIRDKDFQAMHSDASFRKLFAATNLLRNGK